MTNFNQYSGQAMDLASQEGNQGVESAAMMGMGGSQANAIKNRMKRSAMTDVYKQYNQGLKGTLQAQMGLDNRISGLLDELSGGGSCGGGNKNCGNPTMQIFGGGGFGAIGKVVMGKVIDNSGLGGILSG